MQPTPDASQVSALLDAALVPYAWVVAIAIEALFSAFTADAKTWTPPAWAKALVLLGVSFGIAAAKFQVAPVHDGTLASVWYVQAVVFFTVAVLAHKAMQATYGPTSTPGAVRVAGAAGLGLIVALSAALAVLGAPAANAEPAPSLASDSTATRSILDMRNLSGGLELVGAAYQRDATGARTTAVEGKAALSYGVTDMLSLGAGLIGSPKAKTWIDYARLMDCLNPSSESWQLGAGIELRRYHGAGYQWLAHQTSTAAVLAGSWPAVKRKDGSTAIFFKGSADWDVDNGLKTGRLALAWQAFGGH